MEKNYGKTSQTPEICREPTEKNKNHHPLTTAGDYAPMLETLIQYTSHTGENIRVTLKATPIPIPFVAYMGADKNLLDLLTEHYWTDITLTFEASKKTYTYQIDGYTNPEELQAYLAIPQLLQQQVTNHADFKTLHHAAHNAILPLRYTPRQEDYQPGPEWN